MEKEFPHEKSDTSNTGSHDYIDTRYVMYPFGKYEIIVEVTLDNKFIGIAEVKIKKDFLSYQQKIASTEVLDVEEYYKDE